MNSHEPPPTDIVDNSTIRTNDSEQPIACFNIVETQRSLSEIQLFQLTGHEIQPGQTLHTPHELADPGPPVVVGNKVRIYGTGAYYLEFDSWDHLLSGAPASRIPIQLFHPDGTRLEGHQSAWDLLLHHWPGPNGSLETVLYAGVMTPTEGRKQARWPDDNWTRRLYAFHLNERGQWVRNDRPLLGTRPAEYSWIGHNYGHHFERDADGSYWIFYEEVTEQAQDNLGHLTPYKTEIFARRMVSPYQAETQAVRVLGVGNPPYPSTMRLHPVTGTPNGYLVEGPRAFRVRLDGAEFYLLGFSCGDFPTDRYSFSVAWSRSIEGPYTPFVETRSGVEDLIDFGREIKSKHRLSWGPARPVFFSDPSQNSWVMFHGVKKDVLPDRDYSRWPEEPLENFHRNIYLAPVRIKLDGKGEPHLTIG